MWRLNDMESLNDFLIVSVEGGSWTKEEKKTYRDIVKRVSSVPPTILVRIGLDAYHIVADVHSPRGRRVDHISALFLWRINFSKLVDDNGEENGRGGQGGTEGR
jgi:hypothetical protein